MVYQIQVPYPVHQIQHGIRRDVQHTYGDGIGTRDPAQTDDRYDGPNVSDPARSGSTDHIQIGHGQGILARWIRRWWIRDPTVQIGTAYHVHQIGMPHPVCQIGTPILQGIQIGALDGTVGDTPDSHVGLRLIGPTVQLGTPDNVSTYMQTHTTAW